MRFDLGQNKVQKARDSTERYSVRLLWLVFLKLMQNVRIKLSEDILDNAKPVFLLKMYTPSKADTRITKNKNKFINK